MTYYFVSYQWRRIGSDNIEFSEDVIKIHPIKWLIEYREFCENAGDRIEMGITFWTEISKAEYEKYKGLIG